MIVLYYLLFIETCHHELGISVLNQDLMDFDGMNVIND